MNVFYPTIPFGEVKQNKKRNDTTYAIDMSIFFISRSLKNIKSNFSLYLISKYIIRQKYIQNINSSALKSTSTCSIQFNVLIFLVQQVYSLLYWSWIKRKYLGFFSFFLYVCYHWKEKPKRQKWKSNWKDIHKLNWKKPKKKRKYERRDTLDIENKCWSQGGNTKFITFTWDTKKVFFFSLHSVWFVMLFTIASQ